MRHREINGELCRLADRAVRATVLAHELRSLHARAPRGLAAMYQVAQTEVLRREGRAGELLRDAWHRLLGRLT
jgi:hypothetical protein